MNAAGSQKASVLTIDQSDFGRACWATAGSPQRRHSCDCAGACQKNYGGSICSSCRYSPSEFTDARRVTSRTGAGVLVVDCHFASSTWSLSGKPSRDERATQYVDPEMAPALPGALGRFWSLSQSVVRKSTGDPAPATARDRQLRSGDAGRRPATNAPHVIGRKQLAVMDAA